MDWQERMRNLWVERMVWIRHYIISLMMGLRDLSFVATRLLRNGIEISRLFSQFYGVEASVRVENLLTQHVLLLSELATMIKTEGSIDAMLPRWEEEKKNMIEFFLSLNPYFVEDEWKQIIEEQYAIEMDLIQSLQKAQYEQGIADFDLAHENARRIARTMIAGIEKQFQLSPATTS